MGKGFGEDMRSLSDVIRSNRYGCSDIGVKSDSEINCYRRDFRSALIYLL